MSRWEMVRLGDVCLNTENEDPTIYDKDIIYIDISAISSDNKKITEYNVISSKTAPSRARQKVQFGDILVSTVRPNLNAVAIIEKNDDDIIASTGFCVLRPDTQKVDNKYLFAFVKSTGFVRSMTNQATGASYPAVSNKIVMAEQIPLPPLPVQQKIADVLDRASILIEKRKAQIEKLDLLIKSQFIEMFGDPVTNPMGWETDKLSEVTSKIGSGATPKGGKESYIDSGISLIRSMNVHNGYFKYEELAHITDKQAKQLDNVNVQENDVLLNITGASVARSCIVPLGILPARVNQHVSIIRCDTKQLSYVFSNSIFLNESYQRFMLNIGEAGGATRQAITKQQIENFIIILPPIALQTQFAAFVGRVEAQKAQLKKGLELIELEYKSLMQKCLGGDLP